MKKWPALLLILSALLFSACADTTVAYRLSDDNCVSVDYQMVITPEGKDISDYTDRIIQYWNNLGFETDTTSDEGTTMLTGTKTVECVDTEEAAEMLADLFTKESSFFYGVEFRYTPSYFQDDFSLKASVSLENLLRQNESGGMPAAAAQSLLDKAAEGTYTLSIALPGEVVSTNADSQENGVCTWNLAYGEVTDIELSTTNEFSENTKHYEQLKAAQSRGMILAIALGVAGTAALIAAAVLFATRKHSKPSGNKPTAPPGDIVYYSRDRRF